MKTSVLIPTALCNLLAEKWISTISAILINWESTALYLWRSGQSLDPGHFYEESHGMGNEWEYHISEMTSDTPEMLHRWILGKNISSRKALPRCNAHEKKTQWNAEEAGAAPTFHPKAMGKAHFKSVSVIFPAPPAPLLVYVAVKAWDVHHWTPVSISINNFPMYQLENKLPGPKTAMSELSMPNSRALWVKPGWAVFWVQSLTFPYKTICLQSTPLLQHLQDSPYGRCNFLQRKEEGKNL